jgi:hypothetical protein
MSWVSGWIVKAVLWIAYSNQKVDFYEQRG